MVNVCDIHFDYLLVVEENGLPILSVEGDDIQHTLEVGLLASKRIIDQSIRKKNNVQKSKRCSTSIQSWNNSRNNT